MSDLRPAIGARVRVLASAHIPGTAGELGTVIAYVIGDPALVVEVACSGRRIVCEPEDVEMLQARVILLADVGAELAR